MFKRTLLMFIFSVSLVSNLSCYGRSELSFKSIDALLNWGNNPNNKNDLIDTIRLDLKRSSISPEEMSDLAKALNQFINLT